MGNPKNKKFVSFLIQIISKIFPLPYQTQQKVSIIITTMMVKTFLIRNNLLVSFIPASISIIITLAITIEIIKMSN